MQKPRGSEPASPTQAFSLHSSMHSLPPVAYPPSVMQVLCVQALIHATIVLRFIPIAIAQVESSQAKPPLYRFYCWLIHNKLLIGPRSSGLSLILSPGVAVFIPMFFSIPFNFHAFTQLQPLRRCWKAIISKYIYFKLQMGWRTMRLPSTTGACTNYTRD